MEGVFKGLGILSAIMIKRDSDPGLTKEHLSPGGRLDEAGWWQAQHLQ